MRAVLPETNYSHNIDLVLKRHQACIKSAYCGASKGKPCIDNIVAQTRPLYLFQFHKKHPEFSISLEEFAFEP